MVIISTFLLFTMHQNPLSTRPASTATSSQPHLLAPSEDLVIVFAGWSSSGKTTTMVRVFNGLGIEGCATGSVVVSERAESSVEIDLGRIPESVEKAGIPGCICCAQLPDVVRAVKHFRERGLTWTAIEQSPLSLTGDIRSGLTREGQRVIVVFCLNPEMYLGYGANTPEIPLIQWQGIRDADVVMLTHVSNDAVERMGRQIVEAATSDLNRKPLIIVDRDPHAPFSAEHWGRILRQPSKKTNLLSRLASGFLGTSRPPEQVTDAVLAVRDRYSEIPLDPTVSSLEELNSALLKLRQQHGISIIRAKGVFPKKAGQNATGFVLEWDGKAYTGESHQVDGQRPVLSIRSIEQQLRPLMGTLVEYLGIPDCSSPLVDAVKSTYPPSDILRTTIRAGQAPCAFSGDSHLLDYIRALPALGQIPDDRAEALGNALVDVLYEALRARSDILLLANDNGNTSDRKTTAMFNAGYFLLKQLTAPALAGIFEHPTLAQARKNAIACQPGDAFLKAALKMKLIRFEGREELTKLEMERLGEVLRDGIACGLLNQDDVGALLRSFSGSSDKSLRAFLPFLNESFAGRGD